MSDLTVNLDQSALDALLSATPEQLQEALHLKEVHPDGEDATEAQGLSLEPPENSQIPAESALQPVNPADLTEMQQRVINRTFHYTTEVSLRVRLENSLREMEGWMMMIPDGQAKHGMRQCIADMRIELAD